MTTLIAQRPRHRVGRGAPAQQVAASTPLGVDLIVWHMEADGVWSGRLDLLEAGTIRRTPAGYAVEAWDGTSEGVFPTLAAAQLSLEPAHRARLRDEAEPERHAMLRATVAVAGLVALSAGAATGVLTAFAL